MKTLTFGTWIRHAVVVPQSQEGAHTCYLVVLTWGSDTCRMVYKWAPLVQWIAHQTLNLGVVRSSPSWGTLPFTATPKLTPGRGTGSAVLLTVGSMSEWLRRRSNPAISFCFNARTRNGFPVTVLWFNTLAEWLRRSPAMLMDFHWRGWNPPTGKHWE